MCKEAEIDALTRFTESLPCASYLRPWLEDTLLQVHADIRNDFPVAPSPTITQHECQKLVEHTQTMCQTHFAKAIADAKRFHDEANKYYLDAVARAKERLRAISRELERLVY
jgi:hypothetical protein